MHDGLKGQSPDNEARYVSTVIPWPTVTQITTWSHGLGRVPNWVRLVYVCLSSELGYFPGEELTGRSSTSCEVSADGSSINAYILTTGIGLVNRKDVPGTTSNLTTTKWGIKVYAN